MMVPKSVTMYLGKSEAEIRSMGAISFAIEYDSDAHDLAWDSIQMVLNAENRKARFFFVTNRLPSCRSPGSLKVRVSLPDFKRYADAYPDIEKFFSQYETYRRSRLGPNWAKEPWELSPREAFVLRMSESDFSNHFVRDPRERIPYAAVVQQYTLLMPIMVSEPKGFPFSGVGEGPSPPPQTGFPAQDL